MDVDSLKDVLIAVKYEIHAINECGVSHMCDGIIGMDPPTDSFTPYAELTEQQVVDWVHEMLSRDDTLDTIKQELETTLNQSVICSDTPSWLKH